MIELAHSIPQYRDVLARFVRGTPDAILLVEFAGDDREAQLGKLRRLVELMSDLGLPGSVVEVTEAQLQKDIWEVRKAGLNIMMSMKGDGKPVSFIEDCAVPLEHLAEYTHRVNEIFAKHGTRGTWYAHASVGTLHVRPVLNMKDDGARQMRAIAEEICELVKRFKGAYSGEHGDGLVRSEWIEPILGARLTRALAEIKALFDPQGLMNPGKIVRPSRMDDRSLFRFKPGVCHAAAGHGAGLERVGRAARGRGDVQQQRPLPQVRRRHHVSLVSGHARRAAPHTRARQYAAPGPVGAARTGCPGFRCDARPRWICAWAARAASASARRVSTWRGSRSSSCTSITAGMATGCRTSSIAYLPRYAPLAARLGPLLNLRNRIPLLAKLSQAWLGLSAKRSLPEWRADSFLRTCPLFPLSGEALSREGRGGTCRSASPRPRREVVLFADTFNNYFEPENLRAAQRVLGAAGYRVHIARPADGGRPLCCGRTFLAVGMVDEARHEARRLLTALKPYVERGVPVVGLEPSCLLTLRDEYLVLGLDDDEVGVLAERADLFEEFLADELDAGRLNLALQPIAHKRALLHGHCHQKAFAAMPAVARVLSLVPELAVQTVESSCCGMAGAFGYEAEHFDVSMAMGEASLFPAVRAATPETLDRRRRHQLPPSDSRRHGPACRARCACARAGAAGRGPRLAVICAQAGFQKCLSSWGSWLRGNDNPGVDSESPLADSADACHQ